MNLILSEVKGVLCRVDEEKAEKFVKKILEAKRIFLLGQGRSGLIARCFAMRLMHLGLSVYVIGETITPAIRERDLLIVCSASGEKLSAVKLSSLAREREAIICALTTRKSSPLAKIAHLVVEIPVPLERSGSIQPLGSLFEQSLLLYLEGIIFSLMKRMNISEKEMRERHTNLEV